MKKIISTSSAILISGAIALSSVSAETESTSSQAPVPTLYNETTTGSTVGTGTVMPGSDRDSHGCIGSAGYNWDTTSQKCIRPWEQQKQENKNERMQLNQEIKDDRVKMIQENVQNRQMMTSGALMPTGELKNFLRNPLTADEQAALKALLQTQQANREAIMKDSTTTPEVKAAKMKELASANMTALLSYINADKQEAFKKLMEERIAAIGKNQEIRQEIKDNRQEFRQEAKAKRQALSEKLHAQLVAAIENIALEKLNRVLSNIDKAVAKINASTLAQAKKDNFLAQLEEIRVIIQNKIDALTGVSSGTNIVDEVLSGVTSTP